LPLKPGDLVQIIGIIIGANGCHPFKVGMIVGPKPTWSNTRFPVLIGDEILYIPEFELQLLELVNETR
jgi:hypothetical protein